MRGGGSHVPALRRVVNTEGREVIRDNTSLGKSQRRGLRRRYWDGGVGVEAMWRKWAELMTSLIDLQPLFMLLVAPVAVRSTRLSQFQTMSGFYRLYAHCHSVKKCLQLEYGRKSNCLLNRKWKKYVLIEQLRIIKLHKDKATCSSTGLIVIFGGFRRCSQSCRTKHSLLLMLCSCERLLHLNVSC